MGWGGGSGSGVKGNRAAGCVWQEPAPRKSAAKGSNGGISPLRPLPGKLTVVPGLAWPSSPLPESGSERAPPYPAHLHRAAHSGRAPRRIAAAGVSGAPSSFPGWGGAREPTALPPARLAGQAPPPQEPVSGGGAERAGFPSATATPIQTHPGEPRRPVKGRLWLHPLRWNRQTDALPWSSLHAQELTGAKVQPRCLSAAAGRDLVPGEGTSAAEQAPGTLPLLCYAAPFNLKALVRLLAARSPLCWPAESPVQACFFHP